MTHNDTNIIQIVVPPSPLLQESLISIVIIIKKLSVNHGFVCPETLEVFKKY